MADKFWEQDQVVAKPKSGYGAVTVTPIFETPKTPPAQTTTQEAIDRARLNELENPRPTLPAGYRMGPNGIAERIPGLPVSDAEGKPLPAWAAKPYETEVGTYSALANAAKNFKDDFGGNTFTGGLENWLQGKVGFVGTEGQRDWWAAFRAADNKIRNDLFGATLTPSEQQSYNATTIDPSMDPKEIKRNLETRRDIVAKALKRKTNFLKAQGYSQAAIEALAGEYGQDFGFGQQPQGQEQPQDRPDLAPAATSVDDIQFGGDDRPDPVKEEQAVADELKARLDRGDSVETLNAWFQSIGRGTLSAEDVAKINEARAKGTALRVAPNKTLTPEEQAEVDRRAAETDATGAFAAGGADTVTMGALDKAGAAVEAFGDAMSGKGSFTDRYGRRHLVNDALLEKISDDHPWAYISGQVAGGLVLPTFAARTPAQLAKVGTGYGAAYGAGSSDSLAEIPGNVVTGAAIGGGTGWAGGKLVEKLDNRAARKAAEVGTDTTEESAESSASRYARGQRFGIDLSPGDVGGMGTKILERGLDVSPGSANVMNTARQATGDQIATAAENVAGTYGRSTSFEGMGRAAQSGVRKWQDKFEQVAGKAYEAIPISPKAASRLDNTRQALAEMTTIFESNPKMAAAFQNTRLNTYLDALTGRLEKVEEIGPRAGLNRILGNEKTVEVGGALSWNDLKAFRTRIGEEIGDQRFSESPTKTELRRLYSALSEDMRLTAQSQGPDALRKFERANALYREGQQRIDDAVAYLVGDDGKMSAEKAAARIQAMVKSGKASSDLAKIAEIRKSLPPAEAGELVNGIIKLLGQPANSEGRTFAADTFVRNFQDMAPESKNLLFGGANKELRQNLDEFAKVMGDVAANKSTRNTSWTAPALLGAAAYSVGSLPGVLAHAAASYGAARLWTNPRFVRWATGYAKAERAAAKAGKMAPDKAKVQLRLLDKLTAAEPGLAQDINPLRAALNDNTLPRAAASESGSDDQDDGQQ